MFDIANAVIHGASMVAFAIIGVGVAVGVVLISRAIRDYIVENYND